MAVKKITGNEIAAVTEKSNRLSLVDFSSTWCPPCKMLHPVLEQLSEQFSDYVDFYLVDIDQSPTEAQKFSIRGVPTMIVFQGGYEIDRMVGFRDKTSLSDQISQLAESRIKG